VERSLFLKDRRNRITHLRERQRPVNGARDVSGPINNNRRRQADRFIRAAVLLIFVDEDSLRHAMRSGKGTRGRRGLTLIDPEHHHAAPGELFGKSLKIRYLL